MNNSKSISDTKRLSNSVEMPVLGFGTWQLTNEEEAAPAVAAALRLGYRHIDTAAAYGNEEGVGKGLRDSGIPREDIFLTTKLANPVRGYQETLDAFEESIAKLQVDYLDLYLVHWPNPFKYRERWQEANAQSWKAMEELYDAGKIKAIGVCNFKPHHFEELKKTAKYLPMVNQIKLCPGVKDDETVSYCVEHDITIQAYSPLGHGAILADPLLAELAEKHKKTAAQVALRWSLQKDYVPLPKSKSVERIKANADIYDFELSDQDMQAIDQLYFADEQSRNPDETTF